MDPGSGLGRVAAGAPQLPSSPRQECFPGRVPGAPRCHSNPTHPTGTARAAWASLLPEVTYFTCRARAGWDRAARCGRRQPVGSSRGDGRLRPRGESRLPAVVSHGRAATMELLLRFLLLCGVAGESGGAVLSFGSSSPGQPSGAHCPRPPGNNEAWGRGRFGGAAAGGGGARRIAPGWFCRTRRASRVGGVAGRGARRGRGVPGGGGEGNVVGGGGTEPREEGAAAVERRPGRGRVGAAYWVRLALLPDCSLLPVQASLYLLSPFPLLAAVPCPSRVTRFQKPWASADFQVSSCPSQETELQTP